MKGLFRVNPPSRDGKVQSLTFFIDQDGYESVKYDPPKEVIVETNGCQIWVGFPNLPSIVEDDDGYSYRVLIEYRDDKNDDLGDGRGGWYVLVWADGDDEEPSFIGRLASCTSSNDSERR